jgi:hypothetical protein
MFCTSCLNNDELGCKQQVFVPPHPFISIYLSIFIIGDICDCTRYNEIFGAKQEILIIPFIYFFFVVIELSPPTPEGVSTLS